MSEKDGGGKMQPVKPLTNKQRECVAKSLPIKSPRKFRAQLERDDQRDAARKRGGA